MVRNSSFHEQKTEQSTILRLWPTHPQNLNLTTITGVNHGLGQHIQKATPADIKEILILVYAAQIMYILAVATIKFSIIAFIRRVFDVSSTKIPAYIIAGVIMSWLIALVRKSMHAESLNSF